MYKKSLNDKLELTESRIVDLVNEYNLTENKSKFFKKYSYYVDLNEIVIHQWENRIKRGLMGSRLCEVHHEKLIEGVGSVVYGYVEFSKSYLEAMNRFFPYSNLVIVDGEMRQKGMKDTRVVDYCPRCRFQEEDWLKDGGQIYPTSPSPAG